MTQDYTAALKLDTLQQLVLEHRVHVLTGDEGLPGSHTFLPLIS